MSKALNKDNIVSHLTRAHVHTDVSAKTGNPYTMLSLSWVLPEGSTYEQRVLLSTEAKSLIGMSIPVKNAADAISVDD